MSIKQDFNFNITLLEFQKMLEAGDSTSFFNKVEKHRNSLEGYAKKFTKCGQKAKDIVSDAIFKFLVAFNNKRLKHDKLEFFFKKIIYNNFIDGIKKGTMKRIFVDALLIDMPDMIDEVNEFEEIYSISQIADIVDEIIYRLATDKPLFWDVIYLHYFNDEKLDDVASILNITPETCRKRHSDAKKYFPDLVKSLSKISKEILFEYDKIKRSQM